MGGSAALASLTTDASGTIGVPVVFNAGGTMSAPTVTTTGSQTYYNAMLLPSDTMLAAGGNITFYGTVDSYGTPSSLTLAAAENITFNDNIGLNDPLQSLVVTQANQVVSRRPCRFLFHDHCRTGLRRECSCCERASRSPILAPARLSS